jgi:manganese/zinc/iron transport system permease protein
MSLDFFWIVLAALLLSINTALSGFFLVSRNQLMLADALGHSIFPGLFIGFLLLGNAMPWLTLPISALGSMLAVLFIEWIKRRSEGRSDAAMGAVYTLLFSLGICLLSWFEGTSHFDLDCIIYGNLLWVPFIKIEPISALEFLPQSIGIHSIWALVLLTSSLLYGKTWRASDFLGSNVTGRSPMLPAILAAGTVVVSFEQAGAILTAGSMVIPPALGWYLAVKKEKAWNYRTLGIVILSIAVSGSLSGLGIAFLLDLEPGATMVATQFLMGLLILFYSEYATRRSKITFNT